jgi:biopolymer transport protein TolR
MARRSAPEVNAGSMADIAFLLLIFFLVTTTIETDSGINRKLPSMDQPEDLDVKIKDRNIFIVLINKNDELFVEDNRMKIDSLRIAAVDFLNNGYGTWDHDNNEETPEIACDYCTGKKVENLSDHPGKAIISLKSDRETDYKTYIAVQNELVAAYNELRNREYVKLYPSDKINYVEADKIATDPRTSRSEKARLKSRIDVVKKRFPMKLSEAEPTKRT